MKPEIPANSKVILPNQLAAANSESDACGNKSRRRRRQRRGRTESGSNEGVSSTTNETAANSSIPSTRSSMNRMITINERVQSELPMEQLLKNLVQRTDSQDKSGEIPSGDSLVNLLAQVNDI